MSILFEGNCFDQLEDWGEKNPKLYKKIKALLKETHRNPFKGAGKPEPLKHGSLSGYWSRRITAEHRLVYKYEDGMLWIRSCMGHYGE